MEAEIAMPPVGQIVFEAEADAAESQVLPGDILRGNESNLQALFTG